METVRTIDIHAHFFPRAWLELLAAEGAAFGVTCELGDPRGPRISGSGRDGNFLEERFIDIGARIASMDEQGVDVQALSLTAPMVYWAGAELSQARLERTDFEGVDFTVMRLDAVRFELCRLPGASFVGLDLRPGGQGGAIVPVWLLLVIGFVSAPALWLRWP